MPAPTAPIDVTAPAMRQGAGVASGETAPAPTVSRGFDWTQCRSEGGDKDCALCEYAGGVMPCKRIGNFTECPDDNFAGKMKFWHLYNPGVHKNGTVKGACLGLISNRVRDGSALTAWDTEGKVFPGVSREIMVATKVWVTHPDKASKPVGILMFKRVVTHGCYRKRNTVCADVHKMGYCINCQQTPFRFRNIHSEFTTTSDREKFLKECLAHAIDNQGNIKTKFECDAEDVEKTKASLAAF